MAAGRSQSTPIKVHIAHLRTCRWLAPDSALEALTPEAMEWLRERADELLGALMPWLPEGSELTVIPVETERSMPAACERWTAAWSAVPTKSLQPAAHALDAARTHVLTFERALGWARREKLEQKVSKAVQEASAASPHWVALIEAAGGVFEYASPHPTEAIASLHAHWLTRGSDPAHPSPWAPLLAIFERGAWPVLLPDNTLLVYVPVLQGARAVLDPANPDVRTPPRRAPLAALRSRTIPPLLEIGAGPPPSFPLGEPVAMRGRVAFVSTRPREPKE